MAKAQTRPVTLTAAMRVVVLHGPETMLWKLRLDQLRAALAGEHGEDIEPIVLDGATCALAEVFDEVREYSLMQRHKLVVVDQADVFVASHRKALERYAEHPVDHATLVLRSQTWRPGNLDKLIEKVGALVKCDAPGEMEAKQWAVARCAKAHGRTLDRGAAETLVRRVGAHLMALDNELARLSLMVGRDQPITADLVERSVRQNSEEQAWVVQEAMLAALREGRAGALLEKLHELIDRAGQSEVQVGYFLADLLRKLHVAQAMLDGGADRSQAGKAMKLWGERERVFFQVLRTLGPAKVRQMLSEALDAAVRSRQGLGEPVRNLERFCIGLVDQVN